MVKNCKYFKCKVENCSCAFPGGVRGHASCGCENCLNYTSDGNSKSCDMLLRLNESEMEEGQSPTNNTDGEGWT